MGEHQLALLGARACVLDAGGRLKSSVPCVFALRLGFTQIWKDVKIPLEGSKIDKCPHVRFVDEGTDLQQVG